MKLHEPISVLESFKSSKLGVSLRKTNPAKYRNNRSLLLVMPWLLIGITTPLYLHGVVLYVVAGICLLMMLVSLILMLSIMESNRGGYARTQLTKEELNSAKEMIRKHG